MMSNFRNRSIIAMLGGALLLVSPALAEKGGNGNGNGGGHGNAGGNGNSHSGGVGHGNQTHGKSAKAKVSSTVTNKAKTKKSILLVHPGKGKIASKLGALNAAHASPAAFAHAAPNSRIGKIKAYYEPNAAATSLKEDAATAKAEADAAAQAYQDALDALAAAQEAFNADQTDANEQALKNAEAAADAAKLASDQAAADAAAAAEAAATADAAATEALNAAANKTPVEDDTRAALDALLEGKIVLEPEDGTTATSAN